MKYAEDRDTSKAYKQNYVNDIQNLIEQRKKESDQKREAYCADICTNGDFHRDAFRRMLGWPLVGHTSCGIPACKSELLSGEDGYEIFRMQFKVLDGLTMTGLYFRMESKKPRPLVLVLHGGYGTPERIAGFYGDTGNYNDMLHRVRTQGVDVFAPQLLLWRDEVRDDYDVAYSRHDVDTQLKRVGSSATAVEVYAMTRILDYFETKAEITSFGMVGLSYGGFYTLFTAAADTRIKAAISCGFFNTRDKVGWPDWTWFRSAELYDDAEAACLIYPRKLWLEIGNRDALFDYRYGERSFARIEKLCGKAGMDWVKLIVFDGVHEFCKEDDPIIDFTAELFANQKK